VADSNGTTLLESPSPYSTSASPNPLFDAVTAMILDQIAWSDCIIFLVFLAPQLIIHVGLIETAICGIKALPFLGMLIQVCRQT
jgi:hypothetical protein